MKSVKPAHQFLAKPCDTKRLESVIERAVALRGVLSNQALVGLLSRTETLPALPPLYSRLVQEIESERSSMESIGEIISQDVGMTATVLKLVNSAFFGLTRKVTSPAQAVSLLGLDVLRALVLSQQLFEVFDFSAVPRLSYESLWQHSLGAGMLAKLVAQELTDNKDLVDQSFMAGVLHDVGKLVLGSQVTDKYNQVLELVHQDNGFLWEVEQEVLGTSHAEAGAFIMGLWGEKEAIVQAIAFHHRPSHLPQGEFCPLAAVHLADVFEHKLRVLNHGYLQPELDPAYMEILGLSQQEVDRLQQLCQERMEDGGGEEAD